MKIVKQSKMPDGTVVQLEDWQEDYLFKKFLEIGAYPKAKNSSTNKIIEANKTFRFDLTNFKSNKEAEDVFSKLEKGTIKLEDLQEYFYSSKDKFYLGLSENELL